jgi:putative spermidine/putrescine transport system substrate-binding protein
VSATATNPNAGKLWMEHLFSDEGQVGYNKGFCQTARFNTMAAGGKIPEDVLKALPPAESYKAAYFPTLDEVNANKEAVVGGWDATVGANVE